jgi:hypothetical protein
LNAGVSESLTNKLENVIFELKNLQNPTSLIVTPISELLTRTNSKPNKTLMACNTVEKIRTCKGARYGSRSCSSVFGYFPCPKLQYRIACRHRKSSVREDSRKIYSALPCRWWHHTKHSRNP